MKISSSTTAPYLLHTERCGKQKASYGNRFRDALEQEKAENGLTESAEEKAVNEMDRVRKENAVNRTNRTAADEDADNSTENIGE